MTPETIRLQPYAPPASIVVRRDRTLVLDGIATRFLVDRESYGWTIGEVHFAPESVAVFSTRRRLIDAIRVFCEGATRGPGESTYETWRRAIRLCAATGTTSRLFWIGD